MRTKRSHEGYMMLDHRASPGVVGSDHFLPVGEGQQFEAPTYTCSHCGTIVIVNPDRTRAREWCSGCDHYICDRCGGVKKATGVCKTLAQTFDELELTIRRDEDNGKTLIR